MLVRRSCAHRRVGDRVVLPRREGRTALVLGGAGATVWDLLADHRSHPALVEALIAARSDVTSAMALQVVGEVVQQLIAEGLVDTRDA